MRFAPRPEGLRLPIARYRNNANIPPFRLAPVHRHARQLANRRATSTRNGWVAIAAAFWCRRVAHRLA